MTPAAPFCHLHLHTYYSLLDGANPIDKLASRVKELGMTAVAMTDHGNLFGAVEFYTKMKAAGVKPIIGCEIYLLTKGDHREKSLGKEGILSHLTLLCENNTGYHNLCKLVSRAYLQGFYYKPRVDKELLAEFSEGLICLSGCLKGEISNHLVNDRYDDAKAAAQWYAHLFPGRYYLELMAHDIPDLHTANRGLRKLAQELHLPVVATNDSHYLKAEHAPAHEALLCIQTGKSLNDEKRMKMSVNTFYVRSPEEMSALFADVPEAISNSMQIAERCNVKIQFGKYHFPKFEVPAGMDLDSVMCEHARAGLKERWPLICLDHSQASNQAHRAVEGEAPTALPAEGATRAPINTHLQMTPEIEKEYQDRLEEELGIVQSMGFSGYFLIVADFINYAKGQAIPVGPGRGSAAGSLVAYCLNITDINPIPYKLLFERFLNPERISMPDMDIDFCMRRRDEVIAYVNQKYGNVGQIVTFGKMKAKAVIRDVGRVMGLPYSEVDRIAKLVPNQLNITLEEALELEPRLRDIAKQDPQVASLLEIARVLEGFPRHASTHAAGVVISDQPLDNFVPLSRGQQGEVVTQYDMKGVEKVGLIKFDFLGLKTLTVIDDAVREIEKVRGEKVDLAKIPLNDPAVYAQLTAGNTDGIFQLESSGMTDLVMKLKPTCFEDIIALVALFRPGPLGSGMVDDFINRKHGKIAISYDLPQLEEILKDTYGVIVYQEQVMQIASKLANFTLGDADILRRAMGKKNADEMATQKERFLSGSKENKLDTQKAERIFDLMEMFAEYGFNKCVVGETEIINAKTGELKRVEDLYAAQESLSTVSMADDYTLGSQAVTNVLFNGLKPVFEVTTHLGHRITITDNHPLFTVQGWRELKELSVGSRIAVPRQLPSPKMPAKWNDSEIITLGWLISEGNLCHPSSIYFYNNDPLAVQDFVQAVAYYPNSVARVDHRPDNRMEVCVNTGSGLYLWCEQLELLGLKADRKQLPEDVYLFSEHQLALLVGRLWSGDGFIWSRSNTTPYYATSSETLASQLQHLLLRLGIVSRIAHKQFKYRGGYKSGYALYLTGRGSVEAFLDKVVPHIIGRSAVIAELRSNVGSVKQNQESRDTIGDIYWDEIISVESKGVQKTYDLTIKNTHNFVANNIIVHNSHSAAYALVTFQTAYLKTHYPTEYMAALMTNEMMNTDKVLVYMNNCKDMGIQVLPPDVNESVSAFSVVGDKKIRFGLTAVKNVGEGAIESLLEARAANGPCVSLSDFCERIDGRRVNRRVVESLIKCGAFDSICKERHQLWAIVDTVLQRAASRQKEKNSGQESIFDLMSTAPVASTDPLNPNVLPWEEKELLKNEKESLGFYLSGHPLNEYRPMLRIYATHGSRTLQELTAKRDVRMGGVVATIKEITTKRGDRMAFLGFEDLEGIVEVVVFADVYAACIEKIKSGQPLMITAQAEPTEETVKLLASDIIFLDEVPTRLTQSVHFKLSAQKIVANHFETLKTTLESYRGECPVLVHVLIPNQSETIMTLPKTLAVTPSLALKMAVEKIFGSDVTEFQAAAIVPTPTEPRYPRKQRVS